MPPDMLGGYCGSWAGVASGRRDGRWSGTRRRSSSGSGSVGRRLKKSPKRRPDDHLHRRERTERAPAPLPDMGTAGTNAGVAIPLQLENVVGDGGGDVVELLFSTVSGRHPLATDHRVPHPSAAAHFRQPAHRLGWSAGPPQPGSLGVYWPAAWPYLGGVPTGVCAGTQPRWNICGRIGNSTSCPTSARRPSAS